MNSAEISEIRMESASSIKPPRNVTVCEYAAQSLVVGGAGGYEGLYLPERAPYMRDPMNALEDRRYHSVIFCGPSQSGKTESLIGAWLGYTIEIDPADMMIVCGTQAEARDFSSRRVDRLIRKSPGLRKLSLGGNRDNVFDKSFRNGALVNLAWPSATQLSGKAVRRIALTEYDRMPVDVDGEGDAYGLAKKRTTSFMSRGKVLVECSPGFEIIDAGAVLAGHEAPPCSGVLGLYNSGTRHRYYWHCPHCTKPFLAEWKQVRWDETKENPIDAGRSAWVECPECSEVIEQKYKASMNAGGRWISEAERFGNGRKSGVASFWMQGPVAAFQTWAGLVETYLTAVQNYNATGNQEALKSCMNTSMGLPYAINHGNGNGLDAVVLQQRKTDYAKQRQVPAAARFLTTSVDVQKNRFVVQVHAWGEEEQCWIVDRFNLLHSERIQIDGERAKISPFTHAEDWAALDRLLSDEYSIVGTEAKCKTRLVVCDSGGAGDSTVNSYQYATRLKRLGLAARFALLKGGSSRSAARIMKGKPGDHKIKVPLFIVNTTILKDEVAANLAREEVGAGYIHLPEWAGEWFFRELTAEQRTEIGWIKKRKGDNNESFDLLGYARVAYNLIGGDKIDWSNPPDWAASDLGKQIAEGDRVQKTGNESYLEFLRKSGQYNNQD